MPRHPRVYAPGSIYHIIVRGNNREKIFSAKKDYEKFLELLKAKKELYPFKLYAYCLLPNHIHLLLEVERLPTARIMQSLLTAYTRYFNKEYRRKGHLFQGRYKAIICQKDTYLLELVRYIHLNPLRAKLVKTLDDWLWSGHLEYAGRKAGLRVVDLGVVEEMFGRGRFGFERYERFLADGLKEGYRKEYHPGESSPFLGTEDFQKKLSQTDLTKIKKKKENLETILEFEAKKKEIPVALLRSKARWGNLSRIRREFIRKAIFEEGYTAAEVARYLNCDPAYITRVVRVISQLSQV